MKPQLLLILVVSSLSILYPNPATALLNLISGKMYRALRVTDTMEKRGIAESTTASSLNVSSLNLKLCGMFVKNKPPHMIFNRVKTVTI